MCHQKLSFPETFLLVLFGEGEESGTCRTQPEEGWFSSDCISIFSPRQEMPGGLRRPGGRPAPPLPAQLQALRCHLGQGRYQRWSEVAQGHGAPPSELVIREPNFTFIPVSLPQSLQVCKP